MQNARFCSRRGLAVYQLLLILLGLALLLFVVITLINRRQHAAGVTDSTLSASFDRAPAGSVVRLAMM